MTPDDLRRHMERIRTIEMKGFDLLAGTETNILPDGAVDYEDDLLEQLDWVVAACTPPSG